MSDVQEPTEQAVDDGYYDKMAACQQNIAPGFGALGARPMTIAESEQHRRDCVAQQAIYVLEQARQIRANPALMADVRAHIRKLRDDGAALLDDIGG